MTPDGTIVFTENNSNHWYMKLYRLSQHCNITHVGIVCGGAYYESTIEIVKNRITFGVQRKELTDIGLNKITPKVPLSTLESLSMKLYLESKIGQPYNILLLINMWWIRPLWFIWDFFNWCPYSSKYFGNVCSNLLDEAYDAINRDPIKNRKTWYTTPCDWMLSTDFFHESS